MHVAFSLAFDFHVALRLGPKEKSFTLRQQSNTVKIRVLLLYDLLKNTCPSQIGIDTNNASLLVFLSKTVLRNYEGNGYRSSLLPSM